MLNDSLQRKRYYILKPIDKMNPFKINFFDIPSIMGTGGLDPPKNFEIFFRIDILIIFMG